MKSDQSMNPPISFREGDFSTEQRNQQERSESEILSGQSSQSHQTDLDSIFSVCGPVMNICFCFPQVKLICQSFINVLMRNHFFSCLTYLHDLFQMLEEKMMTFVKNELKMFKRILSPELPEGFESQKQDEEVMDADDEKQESSAREGALKITLHILRKMNQKELADTLEKYSDELAVICQRELKSNLKKKFQCVFEGIAKQGNPTLLNKIYTELYITEGGTGEVNNEHELRQIETTTRKQAKPETAIKCNNIFKPLTGQDKRIRTMLTKGVAGIGKTVSVQKFILDWAEGKANQDVQFVFSFPFRELNLMKGDKHTLIELLNHFSMEIKQSRISNYDKYKVVFIFDGLDECRLPLDFQKNKICCDVTESTSVDVLLTNLIKGNLLPSALLWITTRPAAANKIPSGCVDQVTEVRGFNDPQKEEYFRKRFSDEDLASRIISHIKTSRSLHIMCHIPVFCWISATVLEHMLKHKREKMPKTLTEMYTHLVVFHTKQKNEKYLGKELNDHSLVEEIQSYLRSGSLSKPNLSPAQWSALVFVLLTSEKELDVFDLKKFSRSEEGLLRLLPVVKASRAALLSGCGVTEKGCASLVSALKSNPSHLRELDLSNNDLKDSGVKLLSAGLEDPHCKLETLRLSGCLVTEEGCASLVSALRSNPSHLRELDLSYNHPGDSGVRLLSAGLEDPHCRLEKLNVEHGGENRMKPGIRKYVCDLTLDLNTVNRLLSLSEKNRKVTCRREKQPYPDHPERFDYWRQVLCREGLTGCCYWEVEWSGRDVIGVTYKGISRRGGGEDCWLGFNDKSWSLFCSDNSYTACHNNNPTTIDVHSSRPHRVGVYLDWPGGTLSFYRASSDTLTLLYTFTSTFTEPLYPGFGVDYVGSSVSLK
uniref:B30.2/SPRY domain-containing protein n=1 Tax=Salmo trutta TaxID=8032 RepID=A0A674AAF9_SALTR